MSLLKEALAVPSLRKGREPGATTREQLELAMAYLDRRVNQRQLMAVIKAKSAGYAVYWSYMQVANAYRQGWLVEKKHK